MLSAPLSVCELNPILLTTRAKRCWSVRTCIPLKGNRISKMGKLSLCVFPSLCVSLCVCFSLCVYFSLCVCLSRSRNSCRLCATRV